MKLFIINAYDRPSESLIVEQGEDDLFYYIHPDRFERWEDKGLVGSNPTPLEDFGVDAKLADGYIIGTRNRPSVAKYKDDRVRPWQGSQNFKFKKAQ